MGRNKTGEAKRRANERYRANKAAREQDESHTTEAGRPAENQVEGGQHVASGSVAGHRHGVITGHYDARHLRSKFLGDDPGLLADSHQRFAHLLPLWDNDSRRRTLPAVLACRPEYQATWESYRARVESVEDRKYGERVARRGREQRAA